jgi:hypothetical protein
MDVPCTGPQQCDPQPSICRSNMCVQVKCVTAAHCLPLQVCGSNNKCGNPCRFDPDCASQVNEQHLDDPARDSLCEAERPEHISQLPIPADATPAEVSALLPEACNGSPRAGQTTRNDGLYVDSGIMLGEPGIGGGDTGAPLSGTRGVIPRSWTVTRRYSQARRYTWWRPTTGASSDSLSTACWTVNQTRLTHRKH